MVITHSNKTKMKLFWTLVLAIVGLGSANGQDDAPGDEAVCWTDSGHVMCYWIRQGHTCVNTHILEKATGKSYLHRYCGLTNWCYIASNNAVLKRIEGGGNTQDIVYVDETVNPSQVTCRLWTGDPQRDNVWFRVLVDSQPALDTREILNFANLAEKSEATVQVREGVVKTRAELPVLDLRVSAHRQDGQDGCWLEGGQTFLNSTSRSTVLRCALKTGIYADYSAAEGVAVDGKYGIIASRHVHSGGLGKAFVIEQNPMGWYISQELPYPGVGPRDNSVRFGRHADISGTTIAVGCEYEPLHGPQTGAVFLYELDENKTWNHVQTVYAVDGGNTNHYQYFGVYVVLRGNLLTVSTGGNSAVYIFQRNEESGIWEAHPNPFKAATYSNMGWGKMDISNDGLAVALGLDHDNSLTPVRVMYRGSVSTTFWLQAVVSTPLNEDVASVAIDGDVLVVVYVSKTVEYYVRSSGNTWTMEGVLPYAASKVSFDNRVLAMLVGTEVILLERTNDAWVTLPKVAGLEGDGQHVTMDIRKGTLTTRTLRDGSLPLNPENSYDTINIHTTLDTKYPCELWPEFISTPYWTEIDCPDMNLTGPIPASISSASLLEAVDLSSNPGLTGGIPASLMDLTYLQRLDLSGCQLGGTLPTDLSKMTSLLHLDLRDNGLNGTIPETAFAGTQLGTSAATLKIFQGNCFNGTMEPLINLYDLSAKEWTSGSVDFDRSLKLTDEIPSCNPSLEITEDVDASPTSNDEITIGASVGGGVFLLVVVSAVLVLLKRRKQRFFDIPVQGVWEIVSKKYPNVDRQELTNVLAQAIVAMGSDIGVPSSVTRSKAERQASLLGVQESISKIYCATNTPPPVFVSHSFKDAAISRTVYSDVQEIVRTQTKSSSEAQVFFDLEETNFGRIDDLDEKVKDSKLFILVISEDSITSKWCMFEVFAAAYHNVPIKTVFDEQKQFNYPKLRATGLALTPKHSNAPTTIMAPINAEP